VPSYYRDRLTPFVDADRTRIIGSLSSAAARSGFNTQYGGQTNAWEEQVEILKSAARALRQSEFRCDEWELILEYELPRRQKRPDAILLAHDIIFVIEFKIGAIHYDAADQWQVKEYALDLRDFHAESRGKKIVPMLCATEAPTLENELCAIGNSADVVQPVQLLNKKSFESGLASRYRALHDANSSAIDADLWCASAYKPTPTIIEAAELLYSNHDVREISHSYADNLDATTNMVLDVVNNARANNKHCICFVTGVPGAGKTLTGLNVVHDRRMLSESGRTSVFLSGNGPLVRIVREALARSETRKGKPKGESDREVKTFIGNVHEFLRTHRSDSEKKAPNEHVVVFDEAQRAWNSVQMFRKFKVDRSEPSLLIEIMERWTDWAVIVALVGGGQEIFLGEAGLEEWGLALRDATKPWEVVASPEVKAGGASVAGHRLFTEEKPDRIALRERGEAHLSVSVRSPRARFIAEWVNSILEPDYKTAAAKLKDVAEFPIVVTRDINIARRWLIWHGRYDEHRRCGLVASSGALRLRAYGIEVSKAFRTGVMYEKWFLAPCTDVRSSYSLEVAATEFECQGLELDWVGVCWGDDLVLNEDNRWRFSDFRGSRWLTCQDEIRRGYIKNRYRVLLTRARLGMVIWIPPGSVEDPTRKPGPMDRVYRHFLAAGVPDLAEQKSNDGNRTP
jgi:hypothetical protein